MCASTSSVDQPFEYEAALPLSPPATESLLLTTIETLTPRAIAWVSLSNSAVGHCLSAMFSVEICGGPMSCCEMRIDDCAAPTSARIAASLWLELPLESMPARRPTPITVATPGPTASARLYCAG